MAVNFISNDVTRILRYACVKRLYLKAGQQHLSIQPDARAGGRLARGGRWVLCTDCWLPCRIEGDPCNSGDESVGSYSVVLTVHCGVCPVALSLDIAENRPITPA